MMGIQFPPKSSPTGAWMSAKNMISGATVTAAARRTERRPCNSLNRRPWASKKKDSAEFLLDFSSRTFCFHRGECAHTRTTQQAEMANLHPANVGKGSVHRIVKSTALNHGKNQN
jgi:hypothetical protein